LNERQYVESFINNGDKSGVDFWSYISPLAKYYWEKGYDLEQNVSEICNVLSKYYDGFNSDLYKDSIIAICNTVRGRELTEINYIPVTTKELSIIDRAGDYKNRLLLFTCLCYAKYSNLKSSKNNNWVNIERYVLGTIGKSATLSLSNGNLRSMLGELSRAGYLNRPAGADGAVVGRGVSNTNHQIAFIDDSDKSPVLVKVKCLEDAGCYYRQYCGEKYMECQRCHRMVRQTGKRQLYCKNCYKVIDKNRTVGYMKLYRTKFKNCKC
jgi:hypothetical protein